MSRQCISDAPPYRSLSPQHLLPATGTLRMALAQLNVVLPKLCVMIDERGQVKRTFSDGDIRRGLLAGASLDSPLVDVPGREPVLVGAAAPEAEVLDLMTREQVSTVVLIDETGRPVGLRTVTDLQGQILLSSPHIGTAEANYVQQAFDSNWIAPAGPNLEAFETRLAEVSTRAHAIAVSSGTAGLHLALRSLDLPEGAAIYVSDKTFVASLQPIFYERMQPVLIDAEPRGWNMSPEALERRLARDAARGQLPGAIMLVHLYGQPADLGRIMALADHYGIPVIEDAAESLGAVYDNRPSGAHGLISVYSFNGNKILTTSGGGAVVTDDPDLTARMRYLATQGRDPFEHYQHSHIAYNYRMSNILAGIGRGQLEVLDDRVARRRAIYERYRADLGEMPGIGFQEEAPGGNGNRWLTVITLDPDHNRLHPYQVMRALKQRGIETRPSWKPMHMQPLCHGIEFEPHSDRDVVSASVFQRALCLPSGSNLSEALQDHIISSIRGILRQENT